MRDQSARGVTNSDECEVVGTKTGLDVKEGDELYEPSDIFLGVPQAWIDKLGEVKPSGADGVIYL